MTRHLVTVVVVAAWLGAAVLAAAVVAPAAFAVLPTRALAGALVGRVLPPLFVAGVVIGGAAAALQWSAGGRGVRLALPLLVAVACAAAQFAVGPRIARLRSEIGPSVDALAPTDPRRRAFGRLHGVSVLLLGAAGLAAAGTLVAAGAALRARG